jgi:hypothetical protein
MIHHHAATPAALCMAVGCRFRVPRFGRFPADVAPEVAMLPTVLSPCAPRGLRREVTAVCHPPDPFARPCTFTLQAGGVE